MTQVLETFTHRVVYLTTNAMPSPSHENLDQHLQPHPPTLRPRRKPPISRIARDNLLGNDS